jgi:two-component system, sensor histidine kinase
VVSQLGKGSRFAVVVATALPRQLTEQPPATVPSQTMGKLVLVIDDDALVLDSMRGVLKSWGCSVVTASSGVAALACLAELERTPDLIISDYRLADGDNGIRAIERLRKALCAPVPAFLISGDTAPERLREARASGYHLLHKPVLPITLRATISQLLKQQVEEERAVATTAPVDV